MNKEFREILHGFRKTLQLLEKPERRLLAVASFMMLVSGVLTNLPAIILGRLVDVMVGQEQIHFSMAVPFIGLIVAVILAREVLTVIRKYFVENIATRTEKKQTVGVIEKLLKTDIHTISRQPIGSWHGRIFRSIQGLVRLVKLGFLDFFPAFFSALAAIAIALWQKPLLATVMILVIPVGLYIIIKQVSSQKGIRVSLLRGKERMDGTVVEMLGGLETIRVANTISHEVEKVEQVAEELRRKEIRHHISMALYDSAKYLNEGFFYILVICLSIYFSATGVISRGDILVYSILFLSITGPLREIHRILDEAHESSIKVNDLYEIYNQPQDRSFMPAQDSDSLAAVPDGSHVVLRDVSYQYPNRAGQALCAVSAEIRRGEKVGVVGASGCGKTTLIRLLLRLLHDYQGEIFVSGKNLKKLSREEIARSIAYVPQKTYIFSGTIRDNILYGCTREQVSDAELAEVARAANIHDEIMRSLGGYDGTVTEMGNNLSGGQRQRLAIARLMLQSPELLIFDEATSALDNINEALIQQQIETLFKDKTIITIAHRLTTLKNSDRIIVFDKGRIVQEGRYEELAGRDGLFRDFVEQKKISQLEA